MSGISRSKTDRASEGNMSLFDWIAASISLTAISTILTITLYYLYQDYTNSTGE